MNRLKLVVTSISDFVDKQNWRSLWVLKVAGHVCMFSGVVRVSENVHLKWWQSHGSSTRPSFLDNHIHVNVVCQIEVLKEVTIIEAKTDLANFLAIEWKGASAWKASQWQSIALDLEELDRSLHIDVNHQVFLHVCILLSRQLWFYITDLPHASLSMAERVFSNQTSIYKTLDL